MAGQSPRASAAAMLVLSAAAGTEWTVLAGYNTVTHSGADKNDPYALDMQRIDALSDGTPAPTPPVGAATTGTSGRLVSGSILAGGGLGLVVFVYASMRVTRSTMPRMAWTSTRSPASGSG